MEKSNKYFFILNGHCLHTAILVPLTRGAPDGNCGTVVRSAPPLIRVYVMAGSTLATKE